ncbi:helix-turn-helix transcriptional regulator [Roseateles paludis]|uniref:HTH luxR-type domain-containing protein n=1 Tax=Roseateles paludis TaxID=3145238 RepID=A0ABV0FX25_9BURK
MANAVAAFTTLKELCCRGLALPQFAPALLEALHDWVPSARNLLDVTDEQGRLLTYFFEGPVDLDVARLYFEEFHNRREVETMPAFESLRSTPAGVRSAGALSQRGFYESALYREIWRPQGLHSRIEGVVRDGHNRLLGSLVLYRSSGDPTFGPDDEARLAQALPWVAHGLQLAQHCRDLVPMRPAREAPHTALLELGGQLLFSTAGFAGALVSALHGLNARSVRQPWQVIVKQALERLQPQGQWSWSDAPQRVDLETSAGHWRLEGRALAGAGGARAESSTEVLLLSLRRLEPQEWGLVRVLREWALTPGQIRVAQGLYGGLRHKELARLLGVSPSTVVDHVRKLYRSMEVNSVGALCERIDQRWMLTDT